MNRVHNIALTILALTISLHAFAAEPTPRLFTITNNTSTPAQVFITAAGYSYVSKGSQGNLAYDQTGRLDPEGQYRNLQPNESTTYTFKEGARMGFCVSSVMVKFQDQTEFAKAIPKNNTQKGCPNQNIILTREDGAAVATFNYTKPPEPLPEGAVGMVRNPDGTFTTQAGDPVKPKLTPEQQAEAAKNAPPPTTKESVLEGMKNPNS
ncbi:MAG: hypothetical protein AB7F19_04805 [Candidatus Babeliales bacterium]